MPGGMLALEGKHVRPMCIGLLPAAPAAVGEQPRVPDSSRLGPFEPRPSLRSASFWDVPPMSIFIGGTELSCRCVTGRTNLGNVLRCGRHKDERRDAPYVLGHQTSIECLQRSHTSSCGWRHPDACRVRTTLRSQSISRGHRDQRRVHSEITDQLHVSGSEVTYNITLTHAHRDRWSVHHDYVLKSEAGCHGRAAEWP